MQPETGRPARAQEIVLRILRECAAAGDRCPTNEQLKEMCRAQGASFQHASSPAQLAAAGHCLVEVYPRNWRVVEIDGERTMKAPQGVPWLRIDKNGCRRIS